MSGVVRPLSRSTTSAISFVQVRSDSFPRHGRTAGGSTGSIPSPGPSVREGDHSRELQISQGRGGNGAAPTAAPTSLMLPHLLVRWRNNTPDRCQAGWSANQASLLGMPEPMVSRLSGDDSSSEYLTFDRRPGSKKYRQLRHCLECEYVHLRCSHYMWCLLDPSARIIGHGDRLLQTSARKEVPYVLESIPERWQITFHLG
jgi:hypothetical protein